MAVMPPPPHFSLQVSEDPRHVLPRPSSRGQCRDVVPLGQKNSCTHAKELNTSVLNFLLLKLDKLEVFCVAAALIHHLLSNSRFHLCDVRDEDPHCLWNQKGNCRGRSI